MQPSTRAMLWYFWRMSRRNILLLTALGLAAAFLLKMEQDARPASAYTNLVVQVFLTAVFGGCLFMGGAERSFVPHPCLLTLPLATRRYLALFYGYMIFVVGTISCAATAVHLQLFGNVLQEEGPRVVLQFWQMPLLCVALACLIQSMFHLSGIKSEFQVVPMAIAMEVLAFVCVLPVLDPGHHSSHRVGATACFAILFAWACSYNSLSTHRNGRQRGGITALLEWFDLGRGRIRTFSSPNTALFWLGWRRYGRIFPQWALALCLTSLTVVGVFILFRSDPAIRSKGDGFAVAAYIATPVLIFGAAFLCHVLLLMRSHEDLFGPGRGFFLTLPVHSAELARGRVLATVLSVLLVMSAGTAFLLFLAWISPEFSRALAPQFFSMAILFALGLWLTLWFGLPMALIYVLSMLLFFGVAQLLGAQQQDVNWLICIAVLCVAATLFFLSTAIRRRLITPVDLLLFLLAILIPVLATTGNLMGFKTDAPNPLFLPIMQFCLLLPVALPFIAAPVVMNWIRHR